MECSILNHNSPMNILGYNFKKNIVYPSLKIDFVLANTTGPDKIPLYVIFAVCLRTCSLKGKDI